ncbi:MAG TPA: SCO family protein [Xanthomonadales bacterium]|nr:SCO family protein [Xanthomonadales bacterium]
MPATSSNARFILLAISLGLLCLAAGATAWRIYEARQSNTNDSLILLPEPRIIADFALVDQHNGHFSLDGFKGHWSLLFFGFTTCPDVCPNTLYQLQQARKVMLAKMPESTVPQIYLVSVDPERDTPPKLAAYLGYFDPAFTGLTGAAEQLQALAYQLGVAYFIEPHETGDPEYHVDHSASLLLLNSDAQLLGVLPPPHESSAIAQAVMTVIRQGGRAP